MLNALSLNLSGGAIGLVGLLIVCSWLYLGWKKVGRDPIGGPIRLRTEIPGGHPPDVLRYLFRYGWDLRTTASTLVHLAIDGHLELRKSGERFKVRRLSSGPDSPSERALFKTLFDDGDSLVFEPSEHERVKRILEAHERGLIGRVEGTYFNHGFEWWVPAACVSLICVIATTLFNLEALDLLEALIVLAVILMVNVATAHSVLRVIDIANSHPGQRSKNLLVLIAFYSPFWLVLCLIPNVLFAIEIGVVPMLVVLAHSIVVDLFFKLMKAPTIPGGKLLDEIEGLRQSIKSNGDEDRETAAHRKDPGRLVEFARLLPYAMALDCEKEWERRFEKPLRSALKDGSIRKLGWFNVSLMPADHPTEIGIARLLCRELSRSIARSTVRQQTLRERIIGF
jgi:hypothetical protein